MRFATIIEAGRHRAAVVRDDRALPIALGDDALESVRGLAAAGPGALVAVGDWADEQPAADWRPLAGVVLGPAVPDPGAIYTIGLNYRPPGVSPEDDRDRPERPLVYGKAASSVGADGAVLSWDRSLTDNVDAEVELGVVIGAQSTVFGYTIIDDVSSRDEWLDGDQWLLGKSMPGFCPVGPVVVTADELDPHDLRLGCTINGEAIQDDTTAGIRFAIPEIVAFLSRHAALRPGDLIATGTPRRLGSPPGPDRRLRRGDVVTCWIEGIGELTNRVA
jgi:2-keto-4-pentenoate hydratase/2-oxohepta-3-ene-1,7-dioic acid hydratase in catechol pathway